MKSRPQGCDFFVAKFSQNIRYAMINSRKTQKRVIAMVQVVLVGPFEFINSLDMELISDGFKSDYFDALEFGKNFTKTTMKNQFVDVLERIPANPEMLIFTMGQNFALAKMLKTIKLDERAHYQIVTSVNYPMLVTAVRQAVKFATAAELAEYLVIEGRKQIGILNLDAEESTGIEPVKGSKDDAPDRSRTKEIHPEFPLVRIDSRLLHAQIVASWAKMTHFDRILVVSDAAAKDGLTKKLILDAEPKGISANVIPVQRLIEVYRDANFANLKMMLIFREPIGVVQAIQGGVAIGHVNLGSLAYAPGKTHLNGEISVNASELADLNYLMNKNIQIDVRRVPGDVGQDLKDLIRKSGLED